MRITGVDKVVYGVDDMETCTRFFTDWGLARLDGDEGAALFETQEGTQVELRRADDAALPPAIEEGPTVREVVWGVAGSADLDAVAGALGEAARDTGDPERPGATDPNGLALSFRVSRRRPSEAVGSPMNRADHIGRIDERARVYDRAEPLKVGHVVFFTPDVNATRAFYQDRLGFIVSDCYPDAGYFLRCRAEGGHHDLFLLQTPDKKRGLNHVSFTVRDIHEVFGGGLAIDRCGWTTQIGPGRHPISSAYFWYVKCPAGALAEYYADEDYCTAAWRAEEWSRAPENYAEWAVVGGLDGKTRRVKEKA